MYFNYGETETEYLKSKDARLAEVIDQLGHIYRPVDTDLFESVVHTIIAQQISTKAEQTICRRMADRYGRITAEKVLATDPGDLQSLGISFRKEDYIRERMLNTITDTLKEFMPKGMLGEGITKYGIKL